MNKEKEEKPTWLKLAMNTFSNVRQINKSPITLSNMQRCMSPEAAANKKSSFLNRNKDDSVFVDKKANLGFSGVVETMGHRSKLQINKSIMYDKGAEPSSALLPPDSHQDPNQSPDRTPRRKGRLISN